MATTPIFSNGTTSIRKTILPDNTTSWIDVVDNSLGNTSVRIEALNLCSSDSNTVNIQVSTLYSGNNTLIGTVRVVTLSGTDGAASRVNALDTVGSLAADGIRVIEVGSGEKIQAKSLVTVTTGKEVAISGWYRTYN